MYKLIRRYSIKVIKLLSALAKCRPFQFRHNRFPRSSFNFFLFSVVPPPLFFFFSIPQYIFIRTQYRLARSINCLNILQLYIILLRMRVWMHNFAWLLVVFSSSPSYSSPFPLLHPIYSLFSWLSLKGTPDTRADAAF